MIKLIVTDMDGTLIADNKKINDEFWEILPKLKNDGIIFSVASGRQYGNLLKRFEGHTEDIVFIAENGAFGMLNGEELFSFGLNREKVSEFIEIGRTIKTSFTVLCGKHVAYMEDGSEKAREVVGPSVANLQIVDDLTKVDEEILKVALYDCESSHDNLYTAFKEFEKEYVVVVSGEHWLDIMNLGVNKGVALCKVQEKLGIDKSQTMVFGDYLNDIEMFAEADYAFVMENGHDELKKIATHRAKSNNENGVVEAIKEYIYNNIL